MKSAPWRLTLRVIAFLSVIASIAWLILEPGFEPLIGFLSAVAAFLVSFVGESDKSEEASVLTDGANMRTFDGDDVVTPFVLLYS